MGFRLRFAPTNQSSDLNIARSKGPADAAAREAMDDLGHQLGVKLCQA